MRHTTRSAFLASVTAMMMCACTIEGTEATDGASGERPGQAAQELIYAIGAEIEVDTDLWRVDSLSTAGSSQRYHFAAVKGDSYMIEAATGTLSDTVIDLYHINGTTLIASDDDGGAGLGSWMRWTAPADGTYFIDVGGYANATGRFAVRVAHAVPFCPASDDFTIATAGGERWVAFTAYENQKYRIATILGTGALSDSVLTLYGEDASTMLAADDDGGTGLASSIDWTSPANGTFYVKITGYGNATGAFKLTVDQRPGCHTPPWAVDCTDCWVCDDDWCYPCECA